MLVFNSLIQNLKNCLFQELVYAENENKYTAGDIDFSQYYDIKEKNI